MVFFTIQCQRYGNFQKKSLFFIKITPIKFLRKNNINFAVAMRIDALNISEFDYELPEERIAKYPLQERDQSRLLVYDHGKITDSTFANIADFLDKNTVLVANNSKVIPARLLFRKPTGAKIEIFCLEPAGEKDFAAAFVSKQSVKWHVIIGNAKKWKTGSLERTINTGTETITLTAQKITGATSENIVEFKWNRAISFAELLEYAGKVPIPPYLRRDTENIDKERYQTVYAKINGSVAAPTAGLHFTDKVFKKLETKGIKRLEITLHVSAGTFKPVDSERITEHQMHEEWIVLEKNQLVQLSQAGNITAVGTTSLRALESIYWLGVNIHKGKSNLKVEQWQPYGETTGLSFVESLHIIRKYMESKNLEQLSFPTEIIIVPGYQVQSSHALITNFHQPKSTLLLLIAALVGDDWKKIYEHALSGEYRFLSYGDASLLKFG